MRASLATIVLVLVAFTVRAETVMCSFTTEEPGPYASKNMTVEIVGAKARVTTDTGQNDPLLWPGVLPVIENSPKAVVLLDRLEFPNEALKRLVPAVWLLIIDRKLGMFIMTTVVIGNPDNLAGPSQGVCIFK